MDDTQIKHLASGDTDEASRILFFTIPFDIINSAIAEHLDRARKRWDGVNVILKESTPMRARYMVDKDPWTSEKARFDLGEVRVRVLPSQKIELRLINPPHPERRQLTPDEIAHWVAQPDEGAKDHASDELDKKVETEREDHYQWALRFHWLMMHDFLQSLLKELLVPSNSENDTTKQPSLAHKIPKPEDYNTMLKFYDAICDYYETFEKPQGVKIGAFADKHGIDRGTFYKRRTELHRSTPREKKIRKISEGD